MAVKNNLKVILCVGENLKDYKNNKSFIKVKKQLRLSLKKNKKIFKKYYFCLRTHMVHWNRYYSTKCVFK